MAGNRVNNADELVIQDEANQLLDGDAVGGAFIKGIPPISNLSSADSTKTPFKVTVLTGGYNDGAAWTPTGNVAFRVQGTAGSARVKVSVWGDAATDKLVVNQNYKVSFTILNGQPYNDNSAVTSLIDDDNDGGSVTAAVAYQSQFVTVTNNMSTTAPYSKTVWGDVDAGVLRETITKAYPAAANSYCINTLNYTGGSVVYAALGSKNQKYTFTGESAVAHIASAAVITLKNCKSETAYSDIEIGSQQKCSFNYEAGTNYCDYKGNRILLESGGSFGEIGDTYDVTVEALGSGVYFSGAANVLAFKSTDDECTVAGTSLAPAFVPYVNSSVATDGYADASCTVTNTKKVNMIMTDSGAINLDTYDTIWVDLPTMVYDSSTISTGTEASVKVTLTKYPCGDIFTGTQQIGTFVTVCSSGGTTGTSLLFPFMPPMDPNAAPGWWGGFVVVNGGDKAGKCTLTYLDADGATATYSKDSIAPGAQFTAPVTNDDLVAGTGTFSTSKNYSVKASCSFKNAGGFAFVSGPGAAASYTAYTSAGWQ